MSGIRILDNEETKVLLQVTQWLNDRFFIPENKFDEEYFERYMRTIIDNTEEMYETVYTCVNTRPVTVLIYNYVLDIIIANAKVDKKDREIVEVAFTTWLVNMTNKTFEEIFEWLINECYGNRKGEEDSDE